MNPISKAEREESLKLYPVLAELIRQGKWKYPLNKLNHEHQVYWEVTSIGAHPLLLWGVSILFFGLPVLIYLFFAMLQRPALERYQSHVQRYKNRTLCDR